MARCDYNYRVNPSRCIHVFGVLTNELVNNLLPEILRLRTGGGEPITVLINSPGGSVRCLEIIAGALRARDADGKSCRTVTCAIGDAASAAATLLALGDYAIIQPHSIVHFHGIRLSEEEMTITFEDAAHLAEYLRNSNRRTASDLAETVIRRVIHRFLSIYGEFGELRRATSRDQLADIQCFAECLKQRLSGAGDRLVNRTIRQMDRADKLVSLVVKAQLDKLPTAIKQDVKALQQVINFAVQQNKDTDWRLDEQALSQIWADYFLVRDYVMGEHRRAFVALVDTFGPEFLGDAELLQYQKLEKENPAKATQYLHEEATPILEPLWYFTVCMSRHLQTGENRLTASDAYWIGAVDEVVGTDMHGIRQIAEKDSSASD